MAQLFGREYELQQGREVLEQSKLQRVGRMLHIVGEPGVGKTAVAAALAEEAKANGWIVASALAQRSQQGMALEVARRVLASLLSTLGPDSHIPAPGLADGDAMAAAFFRLLEAASLDRPVLIVVDDAQWADLESQRLIVKTLHPLSDRPICVISIEHHNARDDRITDYRDEIMHVGALTKGASHALATSLLPGAPAEVIETIHTHAQGRPLDIVALAETTIQPALLRPSDIAATLETVIARDIAQMDDLQREFLQTCSLISDPIDYSILREIWPNDVTLHALIEHSSYKYLLQGDGKLRFVHDALRTCLRETIVEAAPLHERIIASIEALPSLRIEERQRLAEHGAALGDVALEKRYILKLLDAAEREQLLPVMARALERLIEITPFTAEESLPLYAQLSLVYNGLERTDDANRISLTAIELAVAHNSCANLGQLLVSLLFTLHFKNRRALFDATAERIEPFLTSPDERAHVLSTKLFVAECDFDEEAFVRTHSEFLSLNISHVPYMVRYHTFNATRLARHGDFDGGLQSINRARTLCIRDASVFRSMVDSADAYLALEIFGPGHPFVADLLHEVPRSPDYWAYIGAVRMLCEGAVKSALSRIAEGLEIYPSPVTQFLLLGVAATASALTDVSPPNTLMSVLDRSARELANNISTGWPLPLAAGWAATVAGQNPELARALVRSSLDIVTHRPIHSCVVFYPQVLVKAAAVLNDVHLLRDIADSALHSDALPFNSAMHELARLSARAHLGETIDQRNATAIGEELDRLGAPFFSRFAWDLSRQLRGTVEPGKVLTKREREIAEHVAQGKSNREIAQELTLSERTVEAHITNIYAKTQVGSRAHLASWVVRNS